MDQLAKDYDLILTLEDNTLDGGFGQKIASYLADKPVLVKSFGLSRMYIDTDMSFAKILEDNHLNVDQIVADAQELLN